MQYSAELEKIARDLAGGDRGILAADESTGTIGKRLQTIGVENTEEHRRAYRDLLFSAPDVSKYISGVILYDETIRQKTADGVAFPEFMRQNNMIPGIKVDTGAKDLVASDGEKITEGLDGLRDRLAEYHKLGARFAKWRAVIEIDAQRPSEYALTTNAHALARYAALCQEAGIVPIVEPEVLMDGDHDIARCFSVTEHTLHTVFNALYDQHVVLENILLKPNMVISGKKCAQQASVEEVATETLRCLKRAVPAAVPGIVFLSGGQSDQLATAHLNAMNAKGPLPWLVSFSYGRALQAPALKAWQGKTDQVGKAQDALLLRARLNSAACSAGYTVDMEKTS
ncbi:MAG: fructose-bisphosphate aldolase class I [bacterium]|nr:fructose-bisphosphate aldolase class I [bacterium]